MCAAQLVSGARAAPAGRHAGPTASPAARAGPACPAGAACPPASAPAPDAAAAARSASAACEPAASADAQAPRSGGSPGAACALPAAGPGGSEPDCGAAPAPGAAPGARAAGDSGADPVGSPPAPWPELRYRDAAALARGLRAALAAYSEAGGEEVLTEEGAAAALAALRGLADRHDAVAQGARRPRPARPPRAASAGRAGGPARSQCSTGVARAPNQDSSACVAALGALWTSTLRAVQRRAAARCTAAPRVLRTWAPRLQSGRLHVRAEAVDADFAAVLDRIADKAGQAGTRALADGLLERLADLATAYRADLVD
jgi:hypothetical protein